VKYKTLQPSFGGGEYAPALRGRTDLARFGISGALISNWIVRPTGGMDSRPGSRFVGEVADSTRKTRLLPFQVSEDIAYIVELGHLTARFIANGAYLVAGGVPVSVATPWTEAQVFDVKFTQSADTMFLVQSMVPPQLLRRTGAESFALSQFLPREGPFRSINSNDALLISASATTGTVTVTTNFDLFAAGMVGQLISMEPQALGNIKPWAQGERTPGLTLGTLRRSEGKIYKATTVQAANAPNYTETGNVRPVHEVGREWDGPGTSKVFDTITYTTGVEWEYMHSGFGIVEITAINGPRSATGVVRKTLPSEVVGGVGAPANSWTFSGDASTLTFPVPGASSTLQSGYSVTISGQPVQGDPNYTPPPGGGGGGGPGEPEYGAQPGGPPIYNP